MLLIQQPLAALQSWDHRPSPMTLTTNSTPSPLCRQLRLQQDHQQTQQQLQVSMAEQAKQLLHQQQQHLQQQRSAKKNIHKHFSGETGVLSEGDSPETTKRKRSSKSKDQKLASDKKGALSDGDCPSTTTANVGLSQSNPINRLVSDIERERAVRNLAVLQGTDPHVQELLVTVRFAVLYRLDVQSTPCKWHRMSMEGTLFVFRRSSLPRYRMCLLNKMGPQDWSTDLTASCLVESGDHRFVFLQSDQGVIAVWSSDERERPAVYHSIQSIITELQGKPALAAPAQAACPLSPRTTLLSLISGGCPPSTSTAISSASASPATHIPQQPLPIFVGSSAVATNTCLSAPSSSSSSVLPVSAVSLVSSDQSDEACARATSAILSLLHSASNGRSASLATAHTATTTAAAAATTTATTTATASPKSSITTSSPAAAATTTSATVASSSTASTPAAAGAEQQAIVSAPQATASASASLAICEATSQLAAIPANSSPTATKTSPTASASSANQQQDAISAVSPKTVSAAAAPSTPVLEVQEEKKDRDVTPTPSSSVTPVQTPPPVLASTPLRLTPLTPYEIFRTPPVTPLKSMLAKNASASSAQRAVPTPSALGFKSSFLAAHHQPLFPSASAAAASSAAASSSVSANPVTPVFTASSASASLPPTPLLLTTPTPARTNQYQTPFRALHYGTPSSYSKSAPVASLSAVSCASASASGSGSFSSPSSPHSPSSPNASASTSATSAAVASPVSGSLIAAFSAASLDDTSSGSTANNNNNSHSNGSSSTPVPAPVRHHMLLPAFTSAHVHSLNAAFAPKPPSYFTTPKPAQP